MDTLQARIESVRRQKWVIAILLLLLTSLAIILLLTIEPFSGHRLHSQDELDEILNSTFVEYGIKNEDIRIETIQVDSLFRRKNYLVTVTPEFSKTSFHFYLHQLLWPYQARTTASVQFPEENLVIHIMYNNLVHRTVFINTAMETGNTINTDLDR